MFFELYQRGGPIHESICDARKIQFCRLEGKGRLRFEEGYAEYGRMSGGDWGSDVRLGLFGGGRVSKLSRRREGLDIRGGRIKR